ncbi:type II toxin-antitoxin system YafQ family toxin [Hydrogenivirga sp. 128-5-R1-1]|uniref:type II toxin-antitoxin system YafQ family toxin n=1 Tax=Hydrogenivirga sp. 128-5-R1-1 TaxID=392423 RepID=UPI00015F1E88|nr:type II toxin-antitoxin system YafQ family toxin [Hydrogenivirga sp. 128-5-R1-1]EDP73560.1 hypothetical protein HG1285_03814 [Hydrogenivirga sp. 128-5-R1-1]
MYNLKIHKQFLKDLKKAKLNPTNTEKLFLYISFLINGQELPQEAHDHNLFGEWYDTREFHISGDLLVIYRKDKSKKEIQLLRIGTHSGLFK